MWVNASTSPRGRRYKRKKAELEIVERCKQLEQGQEYAGNGINKEEMPRCGGYVCCAVKPFCTWQTWMKTQYTPETISRKHFKKWRMPMERKCAGAR
jgi:hypothetical protein